MKIPFSMPALIVAVLVTLVFVAIIARWAIVADLAEDVDTHRLTAAEEKVLLIKRAEQQKKEAQP